MISYVLSEVIGNVCHLANTMERVICFIGILSRRWVEADELHEPEKGSQDTLVDVITAAHDEKLAWST